MRTRTGESSSAPVFGGRLQKHSVIVYAMLGVLILVSTLAYASYIHPVVRQSDPATYYYAGFRIAEVGRPIYCDENNGVAGSYFTLLGFKVRVHDEATCFYPNLSIGLPLLIAATRRVVAVPDAVFYLTPVLGVVGLVALFALGRSLFGSTTGLLAFNPVYWSMATEMWSDVPAMSLIVLGTFLAVRMIHQDSVVQGLLAAVLNMTTCQGKGSQNGPFFMLGSHTRPGNGTF